MSLSKVSEIRELSDEKLSEEILAVKKQLFQLRLQKATRQLNKPHLFKHANHRLSQLLTVETERLYQASQSEQEATKEDHGS
jgi:large subunit ribosomal protein L29